MTTDGIGILASAYYLPPGAKTAQEIFADEPLPEDSILGEIDFAKDIGIDRVHIAGDEQPSDLALEAARRAVAAAAIDPLEIDLLVDFTSIPEDYLAPTWSAAGLVQESIGATNALAIGVNTGGCASFHVALKTACAWLEAHPEADTALLFSGIKTPESNHVYYPITLSCDGGSAYVLRKGHGRRVILAVETATVGELHDIWYMQGLANREEGKEPADHFLHMQADLPGFQEKVIPINLLMFRKVIRGALKKAGFKMKDVDYYVYPTFSSWDQESFCRGMRLEPDQIYTESLARHGHLQENDMIVNYDDAAGEGKIADGALVVVTGNGAGFTWSAAVVRD